jgi:hypothetical protein
MIGTAFDRLLSATCQMIDIGTTYRSPNRLNGWPSGTVAPQANWNGEGRS